MSEDRDFRRHVFRLSAGASGLLAGACGLLWGPAEAAGALVGSGIMVANFAGLDWVAGRVLRGAAGGTRRPARPLVWLGGTGARFGFVALAFGVVVIRGWVGLGGLLASLTVLPVIVMVAGLMAARTT